MATMFKKNLWKRLVIAAVVIVAVGFVILTNSKDIKTGFDNMPQKTVFNSEVENIISDNYINDMKCTNEDIEKIIEYAEAHGIKNPYIPTVGVGTDYIIEIRKDTDGLIVVYPHFAIMESINKMLATDDSIQKENVKLAIGDGEWWIDGEGTTRELYLHLDDIYIRIFSAKPLGEEEYIKIAESLVHVKR